MSDTTAPSLEPAIDRDELMRILKIGRSKYYELLAAGHLDLWLLRDVGVGPRFNRRLVERWADGAGRAETRFAQQRQRAALKKVG